MNRPQESLEQRKSIKEHPDFQKIYFTLASYVKRQVRLGDKSFHINGGRMSPTATPKTFLDLVHPGLLQDLSEEDWRELAEIIQKNTNLPEEEILSSLQELRQALKAYQAQIAAFYRKVREEVHAQLR